MFHICVFEKDLIAVVVDGREMRFLADLLSFLEFWTTPTNIYCLKMEKLKEDRETVEHMLCVPLREPRKLLLKGHTSTSIVGTCAMHRPECRWP